MPAESSKTETAMLKTYLRLTAELLFFVVSMLSLVYLADALMN